MSRSESVPADARAQESLAAWWARPDRAVIFDFNGTLSDDEPVLLEIFARLCDERLGRRLDPGDYYARLAGRSDREIIEVLVTERVGQDPDLVEALLVTRCDEYLRQVHDSSPITPAARQLVRELAARDIPVGIVTGAQRPDVTAVLAGAGLHEFIRVVVTEEDVAVGKPDPAGYLRGAELLRVTADGVLAFEDSIAGITAAKAAGMTCLGLPGTRTAADLAPVADGIVERLTPALLPAN